MLRSFLLSQGCHVAMTPAEAEKIVRARGGAQPAAETPTTARQREAPGRAAGNLSGQPQCDTQ
eukprot:746146-Hanusia_phi.AAC.2